MASSFLRCLQRFTTFSFLCKFPFLDDGRWARGEGHMAAWNNNYIAQPPFLPDVALWLISGILVEVICASFKVMLLKGSRLPPPCPMPLSACWNADGNESSWTTNTQQNRSLGLDPFGPWIAYAYKGEWNFILFKPVILRFCNSSWIYILSNIRYMNY